MGNLQAQEFADAVGDGAVSLTMALCWHLQANHYPPYPRALVPVAEKAIEQANEGAWDAEIALPEGITFRDKTVVTVGEAIETFHLGSFLDQDELGDA